MKKFKQNLVKKFKKSVLDIVIDIDNTPTFQKLVSKNESINNFYHDSRPKLRKFLDYKKDTVIPEMLYEDLDRGSIVAYKILLK